MSHLDDTGHSKSRGQFEKLVRATPDASTTPFLARDDIIDGIKEVADTLLRALAFVDADKLIPSTNCGMAPFPRAVAAEKLSALSAGAGIVRDELA